MFSRKRRMPPIARRRKAQLTIPSKFWKPELDKTYQKFDTVYFYGDLWIEREKNLARIVTNLQDMRESLGLWIGLSGWLLRTWRCCNWKIGKKRMQALLLFCPLRFRLFVFAELWFYVFGNLGIFCDNVLRSGCGIGSSEPALFFTLSFRYWECFELQSQNPETKVTLKQTFCRDFDTLDCIRGNIDLLRTSFSAILVSYEIFSTTITISFLFLPNPPVCC